MLLWLEFVLVSIRKVMQSGASESIFSLILLNIGQLLVGSGSGAGGSFNPMILFTVPSRIFDFVTPK